MFQELPHIYVEPHELRKAIQSTGNNFFHFVCTVAKSDSYAQSDYLLSHYYVSLGLIVLLSS